MKKRVCWLLRWRGFLDSRKGELVVNARLTELEQEQRTCEHDLIMEAEQTHYPIRANGALELTRWNRSLGTGEVQRSAPGPSAIEIRQARREQKERLERHQKKEQSVDAIVQIQEQLLDAKVLLHQQLEKNQDLCRMYIQTYVSGVRSGRLKEYSPEVEFDMEAWQRYCQDHQTLDTAIQQAAEESWKRKGEAQ